MPSYSEEQPARCSGSHGPDECRDCLAEMSGPIAVPGWLDDQATDFVERQEFADAWGGR